MALILDTNALSAFADGDAVLRKAIGREPDLSVPAVVLGEYLFGVRHSRFRNRYESWLGSYLPLFSVLQIGLRTAESYAEIRGELRVAGQPIPTNDLWIAALTREHRCSLLSRDAHFDVVRGMSRIGW
jgi:tRNA(fMet)-specific endonuclease VapC